MFDLKNKVALITGGASGIGLKCAKEFLKNQLKAVTLADIDEEFGQNAVEEIEKEFGPNRVAFIKTDVSDKTQFGDAFRKTVDTFKSLDIVVNNAGILNDAIWEQEVAINFVGTVYGTLLAMEEYIPKYKTGDEGVIVNLSSTAGLDPFPMIPVYTGTKFAVQGLSRSFGSEAHYKRTKVRVLALCPGATDTPLLAGMPNRNLGPAYQKILDEETSHFVTQTADSVAASMVQIIKNAKTGTVWMIEGGETSLIEFPSRQFLRKQ